MTATPMEEKIALLLKKAESTDSVHEAEALTAAAEKLMLKNGIDRAMLDMSHGKVEEIVVLKYFTRGQFAFEQMSAAISIARALGLQSYYTDARWLKGDSKGIFVHVVGFESDAADALSLIASLEVQGAIAVKVWAKTLPSYYSPREKWVAKREYVEYFGKGAAKRIKESRNHIVEEVTTGTALVLVSRTEKVDEYYDNLQSDLGIAAKADRRSSTGVGMGAGYRAGQNANTGGTAISGRGSIGR